ncbi:magnesium chelatase subunit H [Stagnihabitans tardus]|uniref:magnesium chelatase n=1 Tax=Stagnihabitans tardus TaxID=2699202 RepID=A0AAE4Y5Z4_9RHOB|nr:magnesium chelatase subunit H [Stagnihabitans tardus]NBZ86397.1 magnesium chelatase subunit H [Stagnihabitans tardus]
MRDDLSHDRGEGQAVYRFVIVTLDAHAAGPAVRAEARLRADFPGLVVRVHAAAEWAENPCALERAREDIARADILMTNLLFLEDHIQPILADLQAARPRVDAMVGVIADPQVVKLTKMGDLEMGKPDSALMSVLKKLKPAKGNSAESGEKQMAMLKRLPKILRFLPGKAQDLRAWFLTMQYWLGGSDENIEQMIRFLVGRYSGNRDWAKVKALAPVDYPDVGLYHPDIVGRVTTDPSVLHRPNVPVATVGLLMLRSYILSGDTAHYDAVIAAFEARGIACLPVFAAGLDGRPAISAYLQGKVDALVSLTGFSLVGGPAYNDSDAAVQVLAGLDVPYVAAHPLEFQTLGQWGRSSGGLSPIETTMLIALPEIDGATNPTVFAGRHDLDGCNGCQRRCRPEAEALSTRSMAPCPERIATLADKTLRLAMLRRSKVAARRVGIVLYGFPPNAGAAGTAAYLGVFESLFNTLHAMASEGYDLVPPASVEALREAVLGGNAKRHGQPANVAVTIPAAELVAKGRWLSDIEATWGPAPGKAQTDGRGVHILGARFGNVFVGLQPLFGYEGDPMRLLFEKGFAPTHAFAAFYAWLKDDFRADALLHFGMHGALEFMPGRQSGLGETCWPDRLIGNMPNIYLYAANNPSEATLAKRRSNAVTITHLTPPLAQSGLYKGLAELKDSLQRYRALPPEDAARAELAELMLEQARSVDLDASDPESLWAKLLETEGALITDGLHVVGRKMTPEARAQMIELMPPETRDRADALLQDETEIPAILRALGGHFVAPVPGGDLIRSPQILPTGRNIHAFDPFRMPTAHALRDGAAQAERLIAAHRSLPHAVALVLWGSDSIKSDGGPIAQALALMGAKPRFDSFGRLSGADLIPLAELGRPRIDVVITLSGIFRDLLPLQTRMLAEAALKAAEADEPLSQNFIRAHALEQMAELGCDLQTAALRVFSNAEGAYGSNVNVLVGSSAFGQEDELADAYESRKGFAYGVTGKPQAQRAVLGAALSRVDLAYQNLESVELGVTTVDHYFDTLGGIARAVRRARGGTETPVYIGDQTRGAGVVRTLRDQVALETRSRSLNPRFFEGLLRHGAEGVRQIEAHVTNTLGWSATTSQVDPWVYQRLTETFVADEAMRRRLSELNPEASNRMAQKLLEASDRNYWQPDAATLAALQRAADELEDRLEGVAAE